MIEDTSFRTEIVKIVPAGCQASVICTKFAKNADVVGENKISFIEDYLSWKVQF